MVTSALRGPRSTSTGSAWRAPSSGATPEPDIIEVARRYEDELEQRGLIDFQKLVRLAVEFVDGHPFIRKVLAARYPRLYVDEYQDLAPGLDRLVRAMCFNYRTDTELFAVGDPDQAILAFTGTRPELLEELARHGMVSPPSGWRQTTAAIPRSSPSPTGYGLAEARPAARNLRPA